MTADQMLWHLGMALESATGRGVAERRKPPLPPVMMRALVLYAPWPQGRHIPTAKEFVATTSHDLEAERRRCISLIDEVSSLPLNGAWPTHHLFGRMSGAHWSRLMAKHLDHHLTQFSV